MQEQPLHSSIAMIVMIAGSVCLGLNAAAEDYATKPHRELYGLDVLHIDCSPEGQGRAVATVRFINRTGRTLFYMAPRSRDASPPRIEPQLEALQGNRWTRPRFYCYSGYAESSLASGDSLEATVMFNVTQSDSVRFSLYLASCPQPTSLNDCVEPYVQALSRSLATAEVPCAPIEDER